MCLVNWKIKLVTYNYLKEDLYEVVDNLSLVKEYVDGLINNVMLSYDEFNIKYKVQDEKIIDNDIIHFYKVKRNNILISQYKKIIDALVNYEKMEVSQALMLSNDLINAKIKSLMNFENVNKLSDDEITNRFNQIDKMLEFSSSMHHYFYYKDNLFSQNNMFFNKYNDNIIMSIIKIASYDFDLSKFGLYVNKLIGDCSKTNFIFKRKSFEDNQANWTGRFLSIMVQSSTKDSKNSYNMLMSINNSNREFLIGKLIENNKIVLNKNTYLEMIENNDRLTCIDKILFNKTILDIYIQFKQQRLSTDSIVPTPMKELFNFVLFKQINLVNNFIKDKKYCEVKNIFEKYIDEDLSKNIEDISLKEKFNELVRRIKKIIDNQILSNGNKRASCNLTKSMQ